MVPSMVIDPVSSPAAPAVRPADPTGGDTAAAPHPAAPPSANFPNPRIEFDAKLGLVVMEFRNPITQEVTRYPNTSNDTPITPGHDLTA